MKIRCSNFKNTVFSILSSILLILAATSSTYAAPIKLYWTDYGAGKIQSANADGTGLKDVQTGLTVPEAIAVDSASGKITFQCSAPLSSAIWFNKVLSIIPARPPIRNRL